MFMLLSGSLAKAQQYTPLVITSGFNEDVIAETSPASTYTTAAVDATTTGANNAFMSTTYTGASVGLPANGLITTIATSTPGLTFQLAAYDQNNVLKINANGGTGTLAIQTTQQLSKLFILATSGSSSSTFTGTITFTDATTQTFGSQSVPDWYDTGTPPVAIRGIGRVPRTGTQLPDNNTGNPKLFQVAITIDPANQTKIVQKIDLVKTSATNGFLNIFAVSGELRPTCIQPGSLGIENLTSTSADLVWVSPGTQFDIKWGTRGFNVGTAGTLVSGFANGGTLSGLTINTNYDYYVRRDCGATDGVSAWSGPFQFRTGYCVPTSAANNPDEIRRFKLSNLDNSSGISEGVEGYKDYSQTVAPARLEVGEAYIASLTSGSGSGTHGAAIWIDYNNDMVFDASEKVAVIGNTIAANTTVNFPSFEVPMNIPPGIYRLRVQYQHNKNGAELNPCAAYSIYAETEDYAVQIVAPSTCYYPANLQVVELGKTTAKLTWEPPIAGTTTNVQYKVELRTSGTPGQTAGLVDTFTTADLFLVLTNLSVDTDYNVYIQTLCSSTDQSNWSQRKTFKTLCDYPSYELVTSAANLRLCEPGEVTLEVATQGVVKWYNSGTSTTPVHTGSSYTTTVAATASLWYEVESTTSENYPTGPLNAAAVGTSQDDWTSSWKVFFTVREATTLQTIDIYPYTNGKAGTMLIRQTEATGSATMGTINYTTVGSGGTVKQVIPINLYLPAGTYEIQSTLPDGGLRRNTARAVYPYTSTVASITGNGYSSSYYMGYYNWMFGNSCKSPREEVVVSIAPHTVTEATVDVAATDGVSLTVVSSASSFSLEYGVTGFRPGTGTVVSTATSPYVFQGLRANTTYDVYIQPLPCGTLYGPVTFTTLEAAEAQQITASDLVKTYGDGAFTHGESDSGLPLSYVIENSAIAAFENGQLVIKGAGTTRITARQAGDTQYLPAEDVVFTLTVNKAMLTVSADPDQQKEYGDADPVFTYTVGGLKYNDDRTVVVNELDRAPGEDLGRYALVQANLYAGPNYTITFVSATFEIVKAQLSVTADALTKEYGDADPVFTYTVTGLKFNDTQVVSGQLARDTGEDVGTYAINQGNLYLINSNYILVYEASELTITPAPLVVHPTAGISKIYGATDPVFTFTTTGLKFNDTSQTVLRGALERVAGENVGLYAYTLGNLSSLSGNYVLTIANENKFEIKPAALTIRVNENQRKTFGQADPLFTYTVEGLQRGDLPAQVMSGRLIRQAGEALGLYPIEQGSLLPRANYVVDAFVPADFEIVSGAITGLSLVSRTFIYDGTPKSLTIQGNMPADALVTYTNNNQINVGVYEVTAVVNYGSNYEPLTLTATLTIVKADQHITFDAPAEVVLEDTPTLQLVATASSSLPVVFSIDYEEERDIATVSSTGVVNFLRSGHVTITARQGGNENYNAAVPVSRTIEVVSKNAAILNLIVDGVSYGKVEKEVYVVIGCDTPKNSVTIEVETLDGTIVTPSKKIVVAVPEYGKYEQRIQVQSAYGTTETYTVIIDKRIPTDKIVYQKYNNLLLVNNNKQTNTGYVFTAYEWFKNNEAIGTGQAYSAGNTYGDVLEVGATYHVELTLHNGKKITSCPIYIEAPTQSELSVYPNPVKQNQMLHVNLDQERQETMSYVIYDLKGQTIQRGELQGGKASLKIPTVASGSYFLVLKTENGQQSVQFIVRE